MGCSSEKSALRATTIFALFYLLSGALMTGMGVYTMHHIPELFTTGSVIWSGIIVFGLGGTVMMFSCCGTVSFRKGLILVIIAAEILLVCALNIVLLETIEWKYGVHQLPLGNEDAENRREFIFFLTCLLSLFGSVIGIVTSVCNLIYAYCVLLQPLKYMMVNKRGLNERVKLHNTVKMQSPRGVPDGNTNSDASAAIFGTTVSEQPKSDTLPRTVPEMHREWVYDDISSDLSVSSGGTEMAANKAFLKQTLHAPTSAIESALASASALGNNSALANVSVLPNTSVLTNTPALANTSVQSISTALANLSLRCSNNPASVATSHVNDLDVPNGNRKQLQRANSSFYVVEDDQEIAISERLANVDTAEVGSNQNFGTRNSFCFTHIVDEEQNAHDVYTAFAQLECASDTSSGHHEEQTEVRPMLNHNTANNYQDNQSATQDHEIQALTNNIADLLAEIASTRL